MIISGTNACEDRNCIAVLLKRPIKPSVDR